MPEWVESVSARVPWYLFPLGVAALPVLGFVDSSVCLISAIRRIPQWVDAYETERHGILMDSHQRKQRAKAQGGALSEASVNGGELSEVEP